MVSDNEVVLVEAIAPFTGHSQHNIVIARDKNEAEEFVKERFRHNPLGDMSAVVVLKTTRIDREKKGILEMDEE